MAQQDRKINLWIFALSLIGLVLVNNYHFPLWNADEAAYAGLAKTMLESGDWISQSFFQSDVHRKPPFHLWGIALSYMIFGINEWAVRLPSSLAILASAWILFKWIRSEKDIITAQLASGIFISNYLILALGKIAFVDAHLVLAVVASAYVFYRILTDRNQPYEIWVLWLILGVGLLIKGPQILIVGGLLLLTSHWIRPLGVTLIQLKPWLGIWIMALPLTLWAWASYANDGGTMIAWMWDWYILKRAQGEIVFGQTGPPGYHLVFILGSFLPFLIAFFLLGHRLTQKEWRKKTLNKYLICWVISGWLIYEFIPSKLPTYAISAYPGLAAIAAMQLRSIHHTIWQKTSIKMGIFLQILLLACLTVILIMFTQAQFGYWGLFLSVLAGLILLVSTIIYVLQLESGKYDRSGMTLVWGNILFCYILVLPMGNLIADFLKDPREMGQHIQIEMKKSDDILLMKEDIHLVSVPFYLSREGQLEQIPMREEAITQAMNHKYKVVIADSTFIPALESKYVPVENYACFDINTKRYYDYLIFYRK